mmetsp:Transcript_14936/g.30263  ORF Transcript_14936/g.30263 Transcript_14936/m.30263 type:complete len:264 (+) Transcript_14936:1759-2550(+)
MTMSCCVVTIILSPGFRQLGDVTQTLTKALARGKVAVWRFSFSFVIRGMSMPRLIASTLASLLSLTKMPPRADSSFVLSLTGKELLVVLSFKSDGCTLSMYTGVFASSRILRVVRASESRKSMWTDLCLLRFTELPMLTTLSPPSWSNTNDISSGALSDPLLSPSSSFSSSWPSSLPPFPPFPSSSSPLLSCEGGSTIPGGSASSLNMLLMRAGGMEKRRTAVSSAVTAPSEASQPFSMQRWRFFIAGVWPRVLDFLYQMTAV